MTKRHSMNLVEQPERDSSGLVSLHPAPHKEVHDEEGSSATTPQIFQTDPPPSPPSHIPPLTPSIQSLDPPSAASSSSDTLQTESHSTTPELPSQLPSIPLHVLIQRALASSGPAQPYPDGSHRAHSLLFDSPPEFLADVGNNYRHSLPVTIEPLRL